MQKIIQNFKITGRVKIKTYKAGTKKLLRVSEWYRNLVVSGSNTGRNLIAQRLAGTNTYSLNITHADIGTGTNPPANTDTQLQTPTVRGALTLASVSNNVVTLQFFLSDATLANGTYTEFGVFIDGTATVSTGQLFNHVLFGIPYVKNTGEDSTIEVEFSVN